VAVVALAWKTDAMVPAARVRLNAIAAVTMSNPGKACKDCGQIKELEEFHRDSAHGQERLCADYEARTICRWLRKHGYPDGFQTLCRGCSRAKARARQEPAS
jgi:hypothetical protein